MEKYNKVLNEYHLEIFTPKFYKIRKHKTGYLVLYIFWYFLTFGNYKIIYLMNEDEIIHFTHILPKFFKFPFLTSYDLEIGPSWTKKNYRGKGLFPAILTYIVYQFKAPKRKFYVLAHSDNLPSQKAIQKAGFVMLGTGFKTSLLGIYRLDK